MRFEIFPAQAPPLNAALLTSTLGSTVCSPVAFTSGTSTPLGSEQCVAEQEGDGLDDFDDDDFDDTFDDDFDDDFDDEVDEDLDDEDDDEDLDEDELDDEA